jgi:hypothetical protein
MTIDELKLEVLKAYERHIIKGYKPDNFTLMVVNMVRNNRFRKNELKIILEEWN